jgi:hypothetical protein
MMAQNISLKEAERKAFASAYQDGLWDIFIGFVLLAWAFAPLLSPRLGDFWSSAVLFGSWPFIFLAIWGVRRAVVTPRVGTVRFGSWRTGRMIRFNVVMLVLLSFSAILGMVLALNFAVLPGWLRAAPFSLTVLIGFSVAAYFLDFTRLYIYGLLFALSPLVGRWLRLQWGIAHNGYPLTFGASAAIAMTVGLVKFVRLLREHPMPTEESPSEGAQRD